MMARERKPLASRRAPLRESRPALVALALLLVPAVRCGGRTDGDGGGAGSGGLAGTGGAAGTGDAAGSGAAGSGGGGTSGASGSGGAGWTECGTPEITFCGIPECDTCPGSCLAGPAERDGGVGHAVYDLCWPSGDQWRDATPAAADGRVLYAYPAYDPILGGFLVEIPFSAGEFLAAHGEGYRVAYADRGKWTGDPLPLPTECPKVSGVELCGGNCGGCGSGQLCTGRSPLHPWGFCVPSAAAKCNPVNRDFQCGVGEGCFTYVVEAEQQPIADAGGICLLTAYCNAAAAGLPGGGKCYD